MRVFLDANILLSGAPPGSRMRAFLEVLFKNAECLASDYAVEEVRRNLRLKRPAGLYHLDHLLRKCELVTGQAVEVSIELKAKDVPILAGAIAGKATHLLTGDQRDFGHWFGRSIRG